MALSDSTINKLSSALTSEVIDYIYADERWVEFLMEIVPDAVIEKMGSIDDDLMYELSMCIMDKIYLKGSNS